MVCDICGGSTFIAAEYRAEGVVAPARECSQCKALILDESVATSEEERESVRIAAAARAARSAADVRRGRA